MIPGVNFLQLAILYNYYQIFKELKKCRKNSVEIFTIYYNIIMTSVIRGLQW